MSYETVRELQRKLYRAAKADGSRKFHSLHDKLYRTDVLEHAWELVKRNQGTYGVDGQSIVWIEAVIGVEEFLAEIGTELKEGTYRPKPVRRVLIPKPGKPNKTRPLSIPTVKDRVCQAAARLVIEPIFEAQFLPNSFGFRPKRSTKNASLAIMRWLNFGCVSVVDADISDCFGSIDTERLVELVAKRISDGYVLALITAWLRAGVMQGDEFFKSAFGVPQGGPISPLLSNIYLHELDRTWIERGYECRSGLDAKLIRYADDILIVSSKPVGDRLRANLAGILGEMGLTLSEEKTRVTTAAEGFDFLGFRFCRRYSKAHGKDVTHFFPTPKAEKRARERVRKVLRTGQAKGMSLADMVEDINYGLRGWTAYYAHTHASRSFGELQVYANNRLRRHLRRRRQRSGLGRYKRMPDRFLYEKLGLAFIRRGRIRYVVS
ncbi:MAG: group II intron reverse transcriptase/maturase [Acidimicrobiales bacterium]